MSLPSMISPVHASMKRSPVGGGGGSRQMGDLNIPQAILSMVKSTENITIVFLGTGYRAGSSTTDHNQKMLDLMQGLAVSRLEVVRQGKVIPEVAPPGGALMEVVKEESHATPYRLSLLLGHKNARDRVKYYIIMPPGRATPQPGATMDVKFVCNGVSYLMSRDLTHATIEKLLPEVTADRTFGQTITNFVGGGGTTLFNNCVGLPLPLLATGVIMYALSELCPVQVGRFFGAVPEEEKGAGSSC